MPSDVLSVQTLNAEGIVRAADPGSQQRGRMYYVGGRVRLERADRSEARLRVRGSRPQPYLVTARVTPGGQLLLTCDCPLAEDEPGVICKHKVAAVLALQDHLRAHPPTTWEGVLSRALTAAEASASRRTGTAAARNLLLFSLQSRYRGWDVIPCSLPVSAFEGDPPGDAAGVLREIKRQKLASEIKEVRRVDARRFVNATPEAIRAAQMGVMTQQFGYYYGLDRSVIAESLYPALVQCLCFQGTQQNPLQRAIRVVAERAPATLALDTTEEGGLRIAPTAALSEATLRLDPKKTEIVWENPLWLLAENTLFPLDGPHEILLPLLHGGETLVVPAEDRDAFLDQYLLPLAERVALGGSAVRWEEPADGGPPVPRLYLTEENKLLRAHLRFGYGPHEFPFDKSLPEAGIQRKPDEALTLLRIRRDPAAEERAWQSLGGATYGLKRDAEPGYFVLRARTDPVDFLLHHVPRLAEAGFEVYGEEALTTARVNRNRPTLSLNVSSGIDWFDIEAVAHWGDLAVGLKDLRQALRRRERFVKLADGSLGEIPSEWVERYRHLFAFAEETAEGDLRLNQRHLTLLDQVLDTADSAQADAEFERRKQRLRDFTQIQPKPVPKGFTGELRPYQKAGYDWLHFLHDYGFGGCLADDMGTGKTIGALCLLQSLRESGHAKAADLLVLPRSLLFNWQREAERFTPGLRLLLHTDQGRPRDAAEFDKHDLVLTTSRTRLLSPPGPRARFRPSTGSPSPARRSRTTPSSYGPSSPFSIPDCWAASTTSARSSPVPSSARATRKPPSFCAGSSGPFCCGAPRIRWPASCRRAPSACS
jgi:non-specific serine/threonine protein kinase